MVGATPAPAAQDNPFGEEHSYQSDMIHEEHSSPASLWGQCMIKIIIKKYACSANYLPSSYRKNAPSLSYSLAVAQTPSHFLLLSPHPFFSFLVTIIVPSDTQ